MSSKSKPIYEPKNYIPLLENNDKNSAVDYELENQEQNPQTDSCMPALNNKGKLTNFWLCFIIGKKSILNK